MEAKYGMDDPLGVQMLRYLKGVIVDQDFGVSLKMQKDRPVLDIITEKFPLSCKDGCHRPGMGRGGGHTIGLSGGL